MHLEGMARNTSIVEELPQSLRDDQHEVTPRSAVQDDRQHKEYPWQVKTDIRINPAKATPASPAKDTASPAKPSTAAPAKAPAAASTSEAPTT